MLFLAFETQLTKVRRLMRSPKVTPMALALGLALSVVAAAPSVAHATSPYLEIPDPSVVMQTPAYHYANMSDDEAYAELDKRKIIYSKVAPVSGVRAPIRLTGRLHGVLIRSALPPDERANSIFEICDARLALALDDFTQILAKHDIEEVVHYTMYRPNVPQPGSVAASHDAIADSKSEGDTRQGRGQTHGRTAKPSKRRAGAPAGSDGSKAVDSKSLEKGTKNAKPHSSLDENLRDHDGKHKSFDDTEVPSSKADLTVPAAYHPDSGDQGHVSNARMTASKPIVSSGRRSGTTASTGHSSATRNGKPAAGATKGTPARKGVPASFDDDHDDQPHGTYAPPGTRHPAGLAIDVGSFKKKSGKVLSVGSHFQGKIGDKTCGVGAMVPESEEARELRSIVCEAHDAGVFTYTLTPNYNVAHRDHFHMEIKPGVLWFLYN